MVVVVDVVARTDESRDDDRLIRGRRPLWSAAAAAAAAASLTSEGYFFSLSKSTVQLTLVAKRLDCEWARRAHDYKQK